MKVLRSPFGKPNKKVVADRGSLFLERFITMVKMAMLGETESDLV